MAKFPVRAWYTSTDATFGPRSEDPSDAVGFWGVFFVYGPEEVTVVKFAEKTLRHLKNMRPDHGYTKVCWFSSEDSTDITDSEKAKSNPALTLAEVHPRWKECTKNNGYFEIWLE